MVECSLFATASQLQKWADEELYTALAVLQKQPLTTLTAIEEALACKVENWTYVPAWLDGWATSEEDCAKLMAWEPIECRIHSRSKNGSPTLVGVTLKVLFPRCREIGNCPCKTACRKVN